MKKKHYFGRTTMFLLCLVFAVLFLLPTVLTITNSFMSETELKANYGQIFKGLNGGYVSDKVNLKFIPEKVSFSQYETGLLKSPEYLVKYWNSIILVVPIVVFQLVVASVAAYSFTRWRGRVRSSIFFFYVILMLMPYQVTLVPNFLVSKWLGIYNTRWAIILPGIFAPFSVFLLTKFMRRIPYSLIESAKRGGGVADLHPHLPAPMPFGALLHCDPGIYRLLEHGGAAAYPVGRRGSTASERVSVQYQRRGDRPGLCHGHPVYDPVAAALPPR